MSNFPLKSAEILAEEAMQLNLKLLRSCDFFRENADADKKLEFFFSKKIEAVTGTNRSPMIDDVQPQNLLESLIQKFCLVML